MPVHRPRTLSRLCGAMTLAALALAGCGGGPADPPAGPSSTAATGAVPVVPEMGHVHGVGVNPADGDVYVATHTGVYHVPAGSAPQRVADRYQDTMGFTVVGPDAFLASGHPDLQERDLPSHLGLIASDDAGATWQLRSLAGEADFHALDAAGDTVFGYDAVSGRLLRSPDGEEWTVVHTGPVLDLAAHPSRDGVVLASAPDGRLALHREGAGPTPLPTAPRLGAVDWPAPTLLVGADARGGLHRSADGGRTWSAAGSVAGPVQALDVSEGAWLAATDAAVLRSVDEGATWQPLVRFG